MASLQYFFCLWLIIAPVIRGTPASTENFQVDITVKPLRVTVGKTGTLNCIARGNPLPRVEWRKLVGAFGSGTKQSGNSLVISNAQNDAKGYYACEGFVDQRLVAQDYVFVDVDEEEPTSPKVTVSQKELRITKGQSGSVGCTPTGRPQPKVQWTKAGSKFGTGTKPEGNNLVISNAQDTDGGNYVCTGVVEGTAIWTEYLQVIIEDAPPPPPPKSPRVTVNAHQVKVARGGNARLECVPDGSPLPAVQWAKETGNFSERVVREGNILRIPNVQPSDAGNYLCSGVVEGSAIWTDYLQLLVEEPDSNIPKPLDITVLEGQDLSISCDIAADDASLAVTWSRKDLRSFPKNVKQRGTELVIEDATHLDATDYTCKVTDGSFLLRQLLVKLSLQARPKLALKVGTQTADAGQSLTVECPAGEGRNVSWDRVDGTFSSRVEVHGAELFFQSIKAEDAGYYRCIVQNRVDQTIEQTLILVRESKAISHSGHPAVRASARHVKVARGQNVNVNCEPEGWPSLDVQWGKGDKWFGEKTKQEKNNLVITNAQWGDRGRYVCTGLLYGVAVWADSVQVEVELPPIEPRSGLTDNSSGSPRVKIAADPAQVELPRGASATFDCVPSGKPRPDVQWTREKGKFGAGTKQTGTSLTFSNAQDSDKGIYVCTGVVEQTAVYTEYLHVAINEPKPAEPTCHSSDAPRVEVHNSVVEIPRGLTTTVKCTPVGCPLPRVVWTRPSGAFGAGIRQDGNNLVVSNPQDSDGDVYMCTGVVNGTAVSNSHFQLSIVEPPKVQVSVQQLKVLRGARATVMCNSDGYPLTNVRWSKVNGGLNYWTKQQGFSLVLTKAAASDAGIYSCTGIVIGTDVGTDYLQVEIVDDLCVLPEDEGPGRAMHSRWFYDNSQKKCRRFYYGGVDGNKNNFLDEASCRRACDKRSNTTYNRFG